MKGASGRVGILTGLTAQVRGKAQAYFIKGNSNATGCSANRVQHRVKFFFNGGVKKCTVPIGTWSWEGKTLGTRITSSFHQK